MRNDNAKADADADNKHNEEIAKLGYQFLFGTTFKNLVDDRMNELSKEIENLTCP